MSESFSPPQNTPLRDQSEYPFEPTYANIERGLDGLNTDQLIALKTEYDKVFGNLIIDYTKASIDNPQHPGVGPQNKQALAKGAERYMHIVDKISATAGLSDEDRAKVSSDQANNLRQRLGLMRSDAELEEEIEGYLSKSNAPLTKQEYDQAERLITTAANKAQLRGHHSGKPKEAIEADVESVHNRLGAKLGRATVHLSRDEVIAAVKPDDAKVDDAVEGSKIDEKVEEPITPETTADNPATKTWAERIDAYIQSSGGLESLTPSARQEMIKVLQFEIRHLAEKVSPNAQVLNDRDILALKLLGELEASLAQEPQPKEQPERPLAMPNPTLVEVSPPPPPDAKQPFKTRAQRVEEDLKKYEKAFEGDAPRKPKMIAKHLKRTIKDLEEYNMRQNRNYDKGIKKGKSVSEIPLDPSLPDTLEHAYKLQARFKQEAKDARIHRRIGRKIAGRETPDRSGKAEQQRGNVSESAPASTPVRTELATDTREPATERRTPATRQEIQEYAARLGQLENFIKDPENQYNPNGVINFADEILFANTGEHKDEQLHDAAVDLKRRMQAELRRRQQVNQPNHAEQASHATPARELDRIDKLSEAAKRGARLTNEDALAIRARAEADLAARNAAKQSADAERNELTGGVKADATIIKDGVVRAARRAGNGLSALNQRRQAERQRQNAARQKATPASTPPPPVASQQPNPNLPPPPPTAGADRQAKSIGDIAREAGNRRLDRYQQEHPVRGALLRRARSGRPNSQGTPPPPSAGDAGPGYPNIPPPPIGEPKDSNGNPLRPMASV